MRMSKDDFDISMPTKRLVSVMRRWSPVCASAKLSQRFDEASKFAKGAAFSRVKVQAPQGPTALRIVIAVVQSPQ
jgi:hypothetical protein